MTSYTSRVALRETAARGAVSMLGAKSAASLAETVTIRVRGTSFSAIPAIPGTLTANSASEGTFALMPVSPGTLTLG